MATTGVAGPSTQEGHEVGTVFIGYCTKGKSGSRRLEISPAAPPSHIREATVTAALTLLEHQLTARDVLTTRRQRAFDMTALGYTLSSEEHGPRDLVTYAQRAESVGFDFCSISDHYHPWVEAQGHSPFVWSVLGAIAATTTRHRCLDRRDLSVGPHASSGRGSGRGHHVIAARRPLLVRCRHRRGAERTHSRPSVATT